MRRILKTLILVICVSPVFAQEALLGDLLSVQPVEAKVEGSEELQADYQKNYDELLQKTDDQLAKKDEYYKKEVSSEIYNFNKVLEKGDEKEVTNEKKSMITRLRTLTMTLKKDKKFEFVQFENALLKEIRLLPREMHKSKEDEMREKKLEYLDKFEQEYKANIDVLETFKNTEHLLKSEVSSTPTPSSEQ